MNWDSEIFETKDEAIKHGFTFGRSDDFNVGHVVGGFLTGFYWMDRELKDFNLDQIAIEIGLDTHEEGILPF